MKNRSELTQNEKYIVQGRIAQCEDAKTIAKTIGRKAKTVQKYIDGELDNVHSTIARVQQEISQQEASQALQTDQESQQQPKPKRVAKNQGFVNETAGGDKGVAISTQVASEVSDELIKKYPSSISRTVRGNLYKIDEQEIEQ